MKQTKNDKTDFRAVLRTVIDQPGKIQQAYSAFHNYSTQNQMLILFQCMTREIPVGPIGTFKFWESKGRSVLKGSKALALLVPCSFSKEVETDDGETETKTKTFFKEKRAWFVLSQTDGETFEIDTLSIPKFDQSQMLKTLDIKLIPFNHTDGNVQGFAVKGKREVAVNPLAGLPFKTLIHEVAHIELGHTDESIHDSASMPKNLKEVEAESVALLVLESLGLPGSEFCRGYIKSWLFDANEIPESNAKRIMRVADKILKSGRVDSPLHGPKGAVGSTSA